MPIRMLFFFFFFLDNLSYNSHFMTLFDPFSTSGWLSILLPLPHSRTVLVINAMSISWLTYNHCGNPLEILINILPSADRHQV